MKGPDTESTQLLRFEGYRDRLVQLGVAEVGITLLKANHYNRASGYNAYHHYLTSTPQHAWAEAMFCENDILAIGVLDALASTAPDHHLGIVGYDNIELAGSSRYQLTTFAQPLSDMLQEAVYRLTAPDSEPRQYQHHDQLQLRRSHLR
jgi:LacI family transcriptional regulator